MGDVSSGDAHWWMRWIHRVASKRSKETQQGSKTNASSHSGISGVAWRDAHHTTRTMAILMPNSEAIPEQPRTVLEADTDGCVRWIVQLHPDNTHGLDEPLDVLLWMWADGSIHVASRPTFEPQWSWSPPTYADRI